MRRRSSELAVLTTRHFTRIVVSLCPTPLQCARLPPPPRPRPSRSLVRSRHSQCQGGRVFVQTLSWTLLHSFRFAAGQARPIFPFTAIVGQDEMKLALILNVIDPKIGGVMIMGDRGTGKSTTIRALADLLPEMKVRPEAGGLHAEACGRAQLGVAQLPGAVRQSRDLCPAGHRKRPLQLGPDQPGAHE
jgi:hypothetical protein